MEASLEKADSSIPSINETPSHSPQGLFLTSGPVSSQSTPQQVELPPDSGLQLTPTVTTTPTENIMSEIRPSPSTPKVLRYFAKNPLTTGFLTPTGESNETQKPTKPESSYIETPGYPFAFQSSQTNILSQSPVSTSTQLS